ncbi:hypothetical protein LR48_Vigan247s000500 [Vigna angularis]|uniref:CCHC-type domain-containing protein n=1 Tax=Phaseolus angularis TaxID=3914 RepID=A0A0L9T6S7_PHAAN|nr:hypothetical protein LR48_Vigan247s000500 [Vigna angularis]
MANVKSSDSQILKEKKDYQGSSSSFKCYGCGERGHVKAYCSSNKRSKERKEKKIHKKKKVHIAWEDNASTTSSSSDSVEEANLCLTVNIDDTASQVSCSSLDTSEFDVQKAFLELLDESEKWNAAHKNLKKEFKELRIKYEKALDEEVSLRNKICNLEMKESSNVEHPVECLSCKNHMFNIDILENLLSKATKSVSHVFRRSNVRNKEVHHKKSKVKRTRRVWVDKGTTVKTKLHGVCCFYCMKKGHTSNKCRIKHFDVPDGKCAWIPIIKLKYSKAIPCKDFKGHFFKVMPLETEYQSFFFPNKEAKFPFYWTKDRKKVISWPKPRMTPEDLDLINQLCQLPLKSSCLALIGFLGNKDLPSNVFDYLSKMDPSKSSTFARLFAQTGGYIRNPGGSSSRAPTTAVVPATSLPVQKALPPPPAVEVPSPNSPHRPADKAPQSESIPKKSLSPNSWVAKRIHFDLFAEEKALFSGMTEEEASDMAMELAARLTMCLAYAAQKRGLASTKLQALQEKFDVVVKSNQDLTLRLAKTERMAEEDKKKASTLYAEARATQRRMQRSLDDAKLDFQKATTSSTKLTTERDGLLAERDSLQDRVTKLEADNKLLGDEVVNEHLLEFEKALAQCNLLFQVPTDDPRLDVSMMVVDEKLVPIHVPPPSPPAVPNVEAIVEVIAETDGVDVQP